MNCSKQLAEISGKMSQVAETLHQGRSATGLAGGRP
jgi:hypothetical protein